LKQPALQTARADVGSCAVRTTYGRSIHKRELLVAPFRKGRPAKSRDLDRVRKAIHDAGA
jgi:hypothetical protein